MEESKELQGSYKIFRVLVYVSLLLEFFEYAIQPEMLDFWNGILCDIHDRMKQWLIYRDGNLVLSKVATFVLVCITCVGTRNKKHLEFDARRQVLYPLVVGFAVIILSVWLFGFLITPRFYSLPLNIWLYMSASILGTVLVHIALDNISKFLKEGLLKDRFNFENESFEQTTKEANNKYSVNIPMRYYYKELFTWIFPCWKSTTYSVVSVLRHKRETNLPKNVSSLFSCGKGTKFSPNTMKLSKRILSRWEILY